MWVVFYQTELTSNVCWKFVLMGRWSFTEDVCREGDVVGICEKPPGAVHIW
jgi:hypothetical protein